jgi:putative transposase
MTAQRRDELAFYVQKSFDDSDGTYGYRRVHADLADWGITCGPGPVRAVVTYRWSRSPGPSLRARVC